MGKKSDRRERRTAAAKARDAARFRPEPPIRVRVVLEPEELPVVVNRLPVEPEPVVVLREPISPPAPPIVEHMRRPMRRTGLLHTLLPLLALGVGTAPPPACCPTRGETDNPLCSDGYHRTT